MTYKETLFFIGKCLTISHEENNKKIVTESIKNNLVNWDNVVKLSTAHYVFPALYCNLKRANLLAYLPKELVNYMIYITNLNRERNQQIIAQAKELNELLLKHQITPIFLKGTGFLLNNLYEDIAERMVGDIDFLVANQDFKKTVEILKKENYQKTYKGITSPIYIKHYPRLQHNEKIAAVEIHKNIVTQKYAPYFNFEKVKKTLLIKNGIHFLSICNQLILTISAKQINDKGSYFKSISLRNSYDLYLLSQFVDSSQCISNYKKLFHKLNPYVALTSIVLHSKSLTYKKNKIHLYVKIFNLKLDNTLFRKIHDKYYTILLGIKKNFAGIIRFASSQPYRVYFIKKITRKPSS